MRIVAFLITMAVVTIFAGFSFFKAPTKQNSPLIQKVSTPSLEPIASPSSKLTPIPTKPPIAKLTIPPNFGRSLRVPILMYHYIGANPNPGKDLARDNLSVTPDEFEKQLDYLNVQGFNSISLDTLYAGLKETINLPPKPVVLTFDDGYIDFYINAFPILKRFNIHATSFLPTQLIGTGYYMNWNQVAQLQSSGLISFQAHTLHHSNLTTLEVELAKLEILQSKKELESHIGVPVNWFSYPYGSSNELLWEIVKQAGFVGGVGTWTGSNINEGNIYDLPRIKIPGGESIDSFAKKLSI